MNTIIDTHLHTWNLEKLDYYWLKNDTSILSRTYAIEEINEERKLASISSAILVQATNNLQESDWLLQLAERYDWIGGAVIWLPLMQPAEVEKLMIKYRSNPFFKGVRHQIHDEPNDEWLLQPDVLKSLSILAEHNIPYDIVGIKLNHLKTAIRIAEKLPLLRLVLDHLNQLPVTDTVPKEEWKRLMKICAEHKNIYAKISGLGTALQKGNLWASEDIKPHIDYILETFGVHKVFCGSDWPVSLLAGSYTYTWKQYTNVIETLLREPDIKKVYHENAEQFYQL
jgi:L-fuconolactonase